jgi:hypothetical protein
MDALYQAVRDLADKGGGNFLVPNLPDLAQLPEISRLEDHGMSAMARSFTISFNQALELLLEEFPKLNIIRLDTFTLMHDVAKNPELFGLKNVDSACYTGQDLGVRGSGRVCANPEKFLFWDAIHLTAAAHEILAEQALAAINAAPVAIPEAVVHQAALPDRENLMTVEGPGDHRLPQSQTTVVGGDEGMGDNLKTVRLQQSDGFFCQKTILEDATGKSDLVRTAGTADEDTSCRDERRHRVMKPSADDRNRNPPQGIFHHSVDQRLTRH